MTLRQDLKTLKFPAKYKKAIAAGVGAGLTALVYALTDGHIDGGEVDLIIAAVVAPFATVFKAPANDDRK